MDLTSGTPWETVKLTTLSRDRRYFPALLSEAQELAKASQVGKMIIYTAWGPEWRPFGQPRSKRLLESVILDKGVKERVVTDIEQFMSRGKWYAERGESALLLFSPRLIQVVGLQAFHTDAEFCYTDHRARANLRSFKRLLDLSTTIYVY